MACQRERAGGSRRIKGEQVRMNETPVDLDRFAVEGDGAITAEQFYHIPVNGTPAPAVALIVAAPWGQVNGTEDFLIEENVALESPDLRVEPMANSPM